MGDAVSEGSSRIVNAAKLQAEWQALPTELQLSSEVLFDRLQTLQNHLNHPAFLSLVSIAELKRLIPIHKNAFQAARRREAITRW